MVKLCVYSVQCRQKVKLNSAIVPSGIIVVHGRERVSAIIVYIQFSVGLCQCIHICVHIYFLVCVCVCQGVHTCVTVSMCRREWGPVVCLCVEGPGCSPDFSWELQWSMCSAEKTSTFTLASSSMSSRAMKQAIDTCIVLGCQSEQEVHGNFRFI